MLFTVHPNGSYASGHYPPASEEAVADRQRAAAAAAAAAEGCGAADESEDAFPFKQAPFYTADLHVRFHTLFRIRPSWRSLCRPGRVRCWLLLLLLAGRGGCTYKINRPQF